MSDNFYKKCESCSGRGYAHVGASSMTTKVACSSCKGTGYVSCEPKAAPLVWEGNRAGPYEIEYDTRYNEWVSWFADDYECIYNKSKTPEEAREKCQKHAQKLFNELLKGKFKRL